MKIIVILVHGTFQSEFPDYDKLKTALLDIGKGLGLEIEVDQFTWTGGKSVFGKNLNNKESIRWKAGRELAKKVSSLRQNSRDTLVVTLCHSHGTRVSMMANSLFDENQIDRIFALSSPYFKDISEKTGSFETWKSGLLVALWAAVSASLDFLYYDPIQQRVLLLDQTLNSSIPVIYPCYLAFHLLIAFVAWFFCIKGIKKLLTWINTNRLKQIIGQRRGDPISLESSGVVSFINHRDEVQYYLGFQERMLKLVYALSSTVWLVIISVVCILADLLLHGVPNAFSNGLIPSLMLKLESWNMVPDYVWLVTGIPQTLQTLGAEFGEPGFGSRISVYLFQIVHFTLVLALTLEAVRWLLAWLGTTQIGFGCPLSWWLGGRIDLRRSPNNRFIGYELEAPLRLKDLAKLPEWISSGHGALLNDEKSKQDWMSLMMAEISTLVVKTSTGLKPEAAEKVFSGHDHEKMLTDPDSNPVPDENQETE